MNVVEIGKHLLDLIKGGAKAIKKFKNTCAAGKKAVKSQGAKQVVKKAVQQTGRAAQQTMKNAAQNMRNVVRDTQQTVRNTVQTVRQTTRNVTQATVRTTRQVAGAARSGVRSGVQAVRQQANVVRQNLAAAQRNFQANVSNFQAGVRGAPRLAVAGDVGNQGAKFEKNVQQFVQSNPAKYVPKKPTAMGAVNDAGNGGSATPKKVPNPYGKAGCPEHRKVIEQAEKKYEKKGFVKQDTEHEYQFKTPGGYKSSRFTDSHMRHPETGKEVFIQVGRRNKRLHPETGDIVPISRERKAIEDIKNCEQFKLKKNARVEFHPYTPRPKGGE